MGRIITKARWIPDPVVTEIDRGNGMKQLMTTVEPPAKEIEYFQWSWKKPKRSNKWVYHSVAIASLAGGTAVLLLPVIPLVSIPVIIGSLAWLGFVGYANVR